MQQFGHQLSGTDSGESAPDRLVMSGPKSRPVKGHLDHALKMPVFHDRVRHMLVGDAGSAVSFVSVCPHPAGHRGKAGAFRLGETDTVFVCRGIDVFRTLSGIQGKQHLLNRIFMLNSVEK